MSLFNRFLKKDKNENSANAVDTGMVAVPVKGMVVPMEEIQDPVFASGALGVSCGIEPKEQMIAAPVTGDIIQLSDTLHAVGIQGENGVQVLLHIGIDTVEMKGDGFCAYVKVGDHVHAGQKLLTVDFEKVKKAGHAATVIVILLNSMKYKEVTRVAEGTADVGESLFQLIN